MNWFTKLAQSNHMSDINDMIAVIQDQLAEKGTNNYEAIMSQFNDSVDQIASTFITPQELRDFESRLINLNLLSEYLRQSHGVRGYYTGSSGQTWIIEQHGFTITIIPSYITYNQPQERNTFGINSSMVRRDMYEPHKISYFGQTYNFPDSISEWKLNKEQCQAILESVIKGLLIEYINLTSQNVRKHLEQSAYEHDPFMQAYHKWKQDPTDDSPFEEYGGSSKNYENRYHRHLNDYSHIRRIIELFNLAHTINDMKASGNEPTGMPDVYEYLHDHRLNENNEIAGEYIYQNDQYLNSVLTRYNKSTERFYYHSILVLPYPVLAHVIDYMKTFIRNNPIPPNFFQVYDDEPPTEGRMS